MTHKMYKGICLGRIYLTIFFLAGFVSLHSQTNYVQRTGNAFSPGSNNTMVGHNAGDLAMTNSLNSFFGYSAGTKATTSLANTFIGASAGYTTSAGSYNTFMGEHAGYDNTTGNYNTFIGFTVARRNTTGIGNVAVGARAHYSNLIGNGNTAIGDSAGFSNLSSFNLFAGHYSGFATTNGTRNTMLGYEAGRNSQGSYNIFLGNKAGFSEPGSNKLYIGNESAQTIIYGDMLTGNILLGVGNPTGYVFKGNRTLNVVGGIITDSIRVAHVNLWSDHVFASNYKLKPLPELEAYVQSNKHLPGIPAEKEVIEEGVNLVLMQAKLLEKIEELTLYVIRQQKEIDDLKKRVKK